MIGRRSELSAIRDFLSGPGPALLLVQGGPRSGKTRLLREAAGQPSGIWLRGGTLPAPLLAGELAASVRVQAGLESIGENHSTGHGGGVPDGPWQPVFEVLDQLSRQPHPLPVVVDEADPLLRDRRFVRDLERWAAELRAHGRRTHLLMAVTGRSLPAELGFPGREGEGRVVGLDAVHLGLGPLSLREAAEAVPDWGAEDVVTLFGLVGGLPDFWGRVDPGVRPSTNLSRLLLSPDAPLRTLADLLVPDPHGRNERALSLLRSLARGAATWGGLREEAGVFRSSSELGPYVKGLQEADLLEASRSLDAPPRSRSRRYRLRHPFLALWHAAVRPRLPALDGGSSPARMFSEEISPEVPGLLARSLPALVRAYLEDHGDERFPGRARESGAAWGDGYDMEVAGTLVSGAAVYGHVHWQAPAPPDAVDRLVEEIRVARYGFGREARLPFLVVREQPGHELARRTARVPGAVILRPGDLVGRD